MKKKQYYGNNAYKVCPMGFSVKRWCKENYVLFSSLYYWKNRFEKKQCLFLLKLCLLYHYNHTTLAFLYISHGMRCILIIRQGGCGPSSIFCTLGITFMLDTFKNTATHIYIVCSSTDFRKQTESISALVSAQFKWDSHAGDYVFVLCNKGRNAIKVLRYDYNGFIFVSKKLLDGMKFQWPRTMDEVKEVTP